MNEFEQQKAEAEIANLKAQAAKAISDAARADAERASLKKSWPQWGIETIKIVCTFVLGIGGATAAITGYQLSEVKKEKMDLEVSKTKASLDQLTSEKAALETASDSAKKKLANILAETDSLQRNLKSAKMAATGNSSALDEAISRAAGISKAVISTDAQLQSADSPPLQHKHQISDYLVGIQTLGMPDSVRVFLNEQLQKSGYGLNELSNSYQSSERPAWFAKEPVILYYAGGALPAAKDLALLMKKLTGRNFAVKRGAGLGVDPGKQDITLFIHYLIN
jgi:hypothetical protein